MTGEGNKALDLGYRRNESQQEFLIGQRCGEKAKEGVMIIPGFLTQERERKSLPSNVTLGVGDCGSDVGFGKDLSSIHITFKMILKSQRE